MVHKKPAIRITLQVILFILFIFWIVFSVLYIRNAGHPSLINWIIMILMILDGVLFISFSIILRIGKLIIPILLIVFLLVNTILTITDQMGTYDWVVFCLNLIALILSVIFIIERTRSLKKLKITKDL